MGGGAKWFHISGQFSMPFQWLRYVALLLLQLHFLGRFVGELRHASNAVFNLISNLIDDPVPAAVRVELGNNYIRLSFDLLF